MEISNVSPRSSTSQVIEVIVLFSRGESQILPPPPPIESLVRHESADQSHLHKKGIWMQDSKRFVQVSLSSSHPLISHRPAAHNICTLWLITAYCEVYWSKATHTISVPFHSKPRPQGAEMRLLRIPSAKTTAMGLSHNTCSLDHRTPRYHPG